MDPKEFEQQTADILCCFFDDPFLDVDGPTGFDAAKIAAQLRLLGDHYDETVIQPLMNNVQKAAPNQAAVVFSNSVDFLCTTWVSERPEIVPEKHLLKATMALSLYMIRNCPHIRAHVQGTISNIVNNQLGGWIMQQGGWERVSSLSE